jgi:hypothetical protein
MPLAIAAILGLAGLVVGGRCGARTSSGFCNKPANGPFRRCADHRRRLVTLGDLATLTIFVLALLALRAGVHLHSATTPARH